MFRTVSSVLLFIALFIIGIIVLAVGYRLADELYGLWSTLCVIISGLIDLCLCYIVGFTIYRKNKDKVDDFMLNEE